jgi:hypothetical protein
MKVVKRPFKARPHRLPPRPAFDYSIHFVKEDSDA